MTYDFDLITTRTSVRPAIVSCTVCLVPIFVASKGPIPRYCSGRCRQRAFRERQAIPNVPTFDTWQTVTEICVVCPGCAFTFDASHTINDDAGGYECPDCGAVSAERANLT